MNPSPIEELRHVCALGAVQSVAAMPRVIPVIHAGPGCGGKLWNALASFNAYQGSGYAGGHSVPCTNTGESQVIFGGEERLREILSETLRVMDGDLYVVLTGCTSDIIGDDTGGVVKEFRDKGHPVVHAETGGFKGSNLHGHEEVIRAIAGQYLEPTERREAGFVNIWSTVPYQDPFWEGNLEALKRLTRSIGLTPNVIFGYGGGMDAIRHMPGASFNLLVSPWIGIDSVRFLEERFGTPFLHYPVLPIGPTDTGAFLRTLADYAGIARQTVEAVIKSQEERYYHYVERIGDFLFESRSGQPTRFVTVCDSFYSTAISRYLTSDLGLIPDVQFVTDDPPEEFKARIESAFQNVIEGIIAPVVFTNDGRVIAETLRSTRFYGRPFLIGSTWDRVVARELSAYPLSVSMSVTDRLILNKTYVGYDGALHLLEDLLTTVLGDYQ